MENNNQYKRADKYKYHKNMLIIVPIIVVMLMLAGLIYYFITSNNAQAQLDELEQVIKSK
ncbi:hypothetical protein [Staphylococcus arlettae]|uniref:hypothetical protein n=1 Tax=Staphylococcus arlettae TaxID=29378 RepID=UPI0011382624|nr:hypothetical protein [Staphylococcus arlettae]UXU50054.1 hypothetical protein MUA37_00700 [Staphylococcus arlettae]UXU52692.1 hypothetical protein MUA71_01055 [Staphylococcus arlettae]BBK26998.1 hypothetical protein SAP2_01820 [Staphylococcus arlettae]